MSGREIDVDKPEFYQGVEYPDTDGEYECRVCGTRCFVIASYDHNIGKLPSGFGVICDDCWAVIRQERKEANNA